MMLNSISPAAVPPPSYYPGAGYPSGTGGAPQVPGFKPFPDTTAYPGTQSGGLGTAYAGYGTDGSAGGNLAFSDKTIRLGFIRKVYSILMCQLAITCAFITLFVFNDSARGFARDNGGLMLVAFGITIVCLLVMSCFESARRTPPTNFIFLFIFTVAESFLLGVISSYYHMQEVLLAAGICTVICFGLTIFAFQTKIDFTMMGGILFVAVLILLIFSIVLMFWRSSTGRLVYACLGAFIFSVYFIYDTQMMIGGNHKYAISPEEYVFAALNLYIDIVQIFLYILSIIGSSRD
ncbi:protein lifeguard 1-like isoform X2 [Planococcus citri]|uniref:protein lifeguard 1-like isoform X2 n=1 Tax=Planococcus citri TaxID=170843 RepID=UPI0031FA2B06